MLSPIVSDSSSSCEKRSNGKSAEAAIKRIRNENLIAIVMLLQRYIAKPVFQQKKPMNLFTGQYERLLMLAVAIYLVSAGFAVSSTFLRGLT